MPGTWRGRWLVSRGVPSIIFDITFLLAIVWTTAAVVSVLLSINQTLDESSSLCLIIIYAAEYRLTLIVSL